MMQQFGIIKNGSHVAILSHTEHYVFAPQGPFSQSLSHIIESEGEYPTPYTAVQTRCG